MLYCSHKGSSSVHAATERMINMKNQWKRFLSLFLCLMLLTAGFSSACLAASKTSGKCGKNAKWSYKSKTRTLTVSGTGEIKDTWSKHISDPNINVVIKEGITSIGKGSFSACSIDKLSLPDSLTTIGASAFSGAYCKMPTSVTIPKNVKKIGNHVFDGCYRLKTLKVSKGSKYFSAKDGVLFNRDKTTLVCCPPEKTGKYTIPDGVKTIGTNAFNHSRLKKVSVPESVTKIKKGAFNLAGGYTDSGMELYFMGHVPSGLAGELENETFCYIWKVTYPQDYEQEWDTFSSSLGNGKIEWYYWWYED